MEQLPDHGGQKGAHRDGRTLGISRGRGHIRVVRGFSKLLNDDIVMTAKVTDVTTNKYTMTLAQFVATATKLAN